MSRKWVFFLSIAVLTKLASTPAFAQNATAIESPIQRIYDDMKQDGLIVDTLPMPYKTAAEALQKLRSSPDVRNVDRNFEGSHLITYDMKTAAKDSHIDYMAFVEGSPFYPSVVRSRLIFISADGGVIQTRRTILCEAKQTACDELKQKFDAMDHRCGRAVRGCPGYEGPAASNGAKPPPPPPLSNH